MDIANIILYNWPTALFSVGQTYESLIWISLDIPKPSEQELINLESAYNDYLTIKRYTHLIEVRLQEIAIQYRYASPASMATYVTSTNVTWQAEAIAMVQWRDAVYEYALSVESAVQGGAPLPSEQDFVNNIPAWTYSGS